MPAEDFRPPAWLMGFWRCAPRLHYLIDDGEPALLLDLTRVTLTKNYNRREGDLELVGLLPLWSKLQ